MVLTKAGPQPANAPHAFIKDSGTSRHTPQAASMDLTNSTSSSVALCPGQNTVQPSPTIMGVLGITLMTLAPSNWRRTYKMKDKVFFRVLNAQPNIF